MKPSDKLKALRERSGLTEHEVAAAIGISSAEYYDLEGFDDIENSLALDKINALAFLLGIRPADLLSEQVLSDRITPAELALLLKKMITDRGIALSQAENEIGWSLDPFLRNPESAILAWNITCLQDVSRAVGCSWLAVLNGIERPN